MKAIVAQARLELKLNCMSDDDVDNLRIDILSVDTDDSLLWHESITVRLKFYPRISTNARVYTHAHRHEEIFKNVLIAEIHWKMPDYRIATPSFLEQDFLGTCFIYCITK